MKMEAPRGEGPVAAVREREHGGVDELLVARERNRIAGGVQEADSAPRALPCVELACGPPFEPFFFPATDRGQHRNRDRLLAEMRGVEEQMQHAVTFLCLREQRLKDRFGRKDDK